MQPRTLIQQFTIFSLVCVVSKGGREILNYDDDDDDDDDDVAKAFVSR